MKKLQGIDGICHLNNRTVKLQRVINNLFQAVKLHIFTKITFCHFKSDLLKGMLLNGFKKRSRKFFNPCGHKQSVVGCKSFDYCFF